MSKNIPLTIACGDYEIVRALKEGIIKPDGIDLTVLTHMDSTTRHWRFLRNQEFDMAEVSGAAYISACDKELPFTALPVYLHRRFRHGFIFINTTKGIKNPTDLIGKKAGVKSWQVTAIMWMRGILEHEYGVPHKELEWFAELDEDVDFTPPDDLRLTRLGDDKSVEKMIAEGELDVLLHSSLIKPLVDKDPRVARLFPDFKQEEVSYYQKTGMFPIMHVLGIKKKVVEEHPWVPINMYHALNEAKDLAMKQMENPRIVPLAWYREAWEEQEALLGTDPWEYGLGERNRKNLELMVQFAHEQGFTARQMDLEELFVATDQGRKRGTEFRI